ncbi:MAG TPA: UPF0175 family protein [Vicinamibacterales bacterium]
MHIELEEDLVALLKELAQSAERKARELIVLGLYREGELSSGRAAELLSMERADFIRHASALGKGVVQSATDEFVVVTGTETHYVLETPAVPDCPFHDSVRATHAGVAAGPLLLMRSTTPRAFFFSGESHHCGHRAVADAKAGVNTDANVAARGPRSGSRGQAFCELFRFETRLCCRTCAFKRVCTKTQALALMPCTRPA